MKENEAMATEKKAEDLNAVIDGLVKNANDALKAYMAMDQQQIDDMVHAMTLAGLDNHMRLAKMAVEETGRGVFEDKVIKNMAQHKRSKDSRHCGRKRA